jgi:hypothetical protein
LTARRALASACSTRDEPKAYSKNAAVVAGLIAIFFLLALVARIDGGKKIEKPV